MQSRFLVMGFIGVVIALLVVIGTIVTRSMQEAASHEYVIVIPEGTGERIEAGEDPDVIPEEIHLVLGKKDVLVIENRDSVGHRISDFWVGAGETLRQEFHFPAVYQGECTIHKTAQVHIIVTRP
ncbi:MAG: hypothetical protein KJ064_09205 [Anaerolineae bacterium]|nr:hypothetical protein [Anaerolineae bacterium]